MERKPLLKFREANRLRKKARKAPITVVKTERPIVIPRLSTKENVVNLPDNCGRKKILNILEKKAETASVNLTFP
ncbi:hypothetical protein CU024_1220 [Enterococcus faecium]|nr:hypothetical protein [Enterococcus faecium]